MICVASRQVQINRGGRSATTETMYTNIKILDTHCVTQILHFASRTRIRSLILGH